MINLHRLPNALAGEKPVLFLRRHWIEVLAIGFYTFVLAAVPALILVGFRATGFQLFASSSFLPFIIVGISIYFLFVLIILFTQFTDYYLDTWIVTTERIINTEQLGLFSRHVSELRLREIQDVTSETHGFLETFLTYGDVYIQSAAEKQRFRFKNIDNPDEVKQIIIRLVQEDKVRHPKNEPVTPMPPAMTLPQI